MEPLILVKYASRSRPRRFLEGLHSIINLAVSPQSIRIACILDQDDSSMTPFYFHSEIASLPKFKSVIPCWGISFSKIHAINRELPSFVLDDVSYVNGALKIDELNWDILVNFSDDMRFVTYGWDQLVRDAVRAYGPDVFLHFPDSTAKGALSTMSIMDRVYYKRDGFIYYPEYWSVFCDNEAQEVAKIRGRYRYIHTQIFDHFHPAYGQVPWDEQYRRQQALWGHDEALYKYREANKFFLDENGHYTNIKYSYPDDPRKTAEAGAVG